MAKPTEFDRQEVIVKATALYWEKGFHATSMRNLQQVIDMRPGSIYATFGSKEALFIEVLKNYTDKLLHTLSEYRKECSSPIKALQLFVIDTVANKQSDTPKQMCMLVKTVAELTDEHVVLLASTKTMLQRIEHEFVDLIKEAQDLGEIDTDKDAQYLASHIQIQIAGLRTYTQIGGYNKRVESMIEDIFAHYPFC